jgi:tRNA U34 2-thiouridine synthase MnmA/TrmU
VSVCAYLGIPFQRLICAKFSWIKLSAISRTNTLTVARPNPAYAAIALIKFGLLLQYARESGCDFLATGHLCACHAR